MTATYQIRFRFDMGKAIAPVGELANQLNDTLAKCGYDERIAITSELPELLLQVNRELTVDEQEKVKALIQAQFSAAFPDWNVVLVCFRRKSGNVQQSAAQ